METYLIALGEKILKYKETTNFVPMVIEAIINNNIHSIKVKEVQPGRWFVDYDGRLMILTIFYDKEKDSYFIQPVTRNIILYCVKSHGRLAQVEDRIEAKSDGTIVSIDDIPIKNNKISDTSLKIYRKKENSLNKLKFKLAFAQ